MTALRSACTLTGAVVSVVWKGTLMEQAELLSAVHRNCACQFNSVGARSSTCAAHAMLLHDQRALKGLLWQRHLRRSLIQQEGLSEPETAPADD